MGGVAGDVSLLIATLFVALCPQVCDGHGGADAANFVRSTLLRSVLMDESLCVDLKEALVSRTSRHNPYGHRLRPIL